MPSSFTSHIYHIIFSTKNRCRMISTEFQERMYSYIGGIIASQKGRLLAAGGMPDHVHLLATLHPQSSVSDVLRLVKSNSSKWIHENFAAHSGFAWQEGYGSFTVSRSGFDEVRAYIARQPDHHQKMTFEEEFVAFLKRHEIVFDERFLWE